MLNTTRLSLARRAAFTIRRLVLVLECSTEARP
jgi:hypothetical protein